MLPDQWNQKIKIHNGNALGKCVVYGLGNKLPLRNIFCSYLIYEQTAIRRISQIVTVINYNKIRRRRKSRRGSIQPAECIKTYSSSFFLLQLLQYYSACSAGVFWSSTTFLIFFYSKRAVNSISYVQMMCYDAIKWRIMNKKQ